MMSDIEKIKRHLARPIPISVTNYDGATDVFYFKPLNIGQQALLMEISKVIREKPEIVVEVEEDGKKITKKVPDVGKEEMIEMFELIKDVVKTNMNELQEPDLSDFCNTNFNQLSEELFKLMPTTHSKNDAELIKNLREARGNDKGKQ